MSPPNIIHAGVQIFVGDCREQLRKLPAESVQCVVTSPPYWGLRDYKIEPSVWGGDPSCKHEFAEELTSYQLRKGEGLARLGQRMKGGGKKQSSLACETVTVERGFCIHCNAWLGCYGLEPTYQLYIEHTVEIFREVWRVLRRDGTLWLNLGDCYACARAGWSAQRYYDEEADDRTFRDKPFNTFTRGEGSKHERKGDGLNYGPMHQPNRYPQRGLKQKDLAGMPWRVAFALQDDGWYLRRDVIWHKKNPMPESVYDRPTTAHEYLFLFSKSGSTKLWRHEDGRWTTTRPAPEFYWRHRETRVISLTERDRKDGWIRVNRWRGFDYYYDFAAIMEPTSPDSHARAARSRSKDHKGVPNGAAGRRALPAEWKQGGPNSRFHRDQTPHSHRRKSDADYAGPRPKNNSNWDEHSKARDRAPKLAEYSTGKGTVPKSNECFYETIGTGEQLPLRNKRSVWSIATKPFKEGHFATFPPELIEPCILASAPKGGVVLDPFGGAGTTGLVAQRLGRAAILIEVNPEYARMASERIAADLERIAADLMGPEEKKRHAIKRSGKAPPPHTLPLFRKRKPVTRDTNREETAA